MNASHFVVVLMCTTTHVVACTAEPSPSASSTTPASRAKLPAAPAEAPAAAPPAAPPAAPAEAISMVFVGDVMFGRYKGKGFIPIAAELSDPFAEVAPEMASDFTMANLETPAMWAPPATSPWDAYLRFVATPERIAVLKRAGVDHVTVANNHYWDMKLGGVRETPEVLAKAGIAVYGQATDSDQLFAVKPVTVSGWKVGILAAATLRNYKQREGEPKLPWAQGPDIEAALLPVIAEAAGHYDLLIVVLHWGAEYQAKPADWQQRAARAFIDAGADAVIGHHPHVLQGMELYKGKLIAYSLGNFLFDNVRHPLNQSAILRLDFRHRDACLARATITPVQVVGRPFRPTLAVGPTAAAIRQRLTKLSNAKGLATTWSEVPGREVLRLELANCPFTPP